MTSGGETMAPNVKPTGQGRPNSQWVTAATAVVVNATQPTASSEMGRRLNRNSRQLIVTADEYMTDGGSLTRAATTATDATMMSSNISIWIVGTMSAQADNTSRWACV